MGGIDTNIDTETELPGMFAAGECACVSINGANRLGSNSLTELLVFGARAGHNAAAFAVDHGELSLSDLEKQTEEEVERISKNFLRKEGGSERLSKLRVEMRETMENGAGIYRSGESLQVTCDKLAELKERFADVAIDDHSATFNTDLTAALELENMLDTAATITHSALARTESRGSHQRSDHPQRDDDKFLKHSLAYQDGTGVRMDYKDVVITRWPPAERHYDGKS